MDTKHLVILFMALIILSTSMCSNCKTRSNEKYLSVAAKVKVYHDDGTRSYKDWRNYKTRIIKNLEDYNLNKNQKDKFGGKANDVFSGSFFHTKKINDRWWIINPEGNRFIHIGVNSLHPGDSKRNQAAFEKEFGNMKKWMSETNKLLRNYGINGAGSWGDVETIMNAPLQKDLPINYTVNLKFMNSYARKRGGTHEVPGHLGFPNNTMFVFDPGFEEFCDNHAKQCLDYKDDQNLLGYFSDNEIPFRKDNLEGYLTLPDKNDPGYIAAKKWIDKRGITLDEITDEHRMDFLAFEAEKYFSIVSNAIAKYDSNHMFIGCRFYGSQKRLEPLFSVAGKYMDIVTVNLYDQWTPDEEQIKNWTNWSGRPFMVTEFYVKGEDSGLPNQTGAGWIVKTQRDRGLFYQNFILKLLESGNCVGWDWHRYQDNDPTKKGAELSNIDSNKGIVDNFYNEYKPMLKLMGKLNNQVYSLIHYFDRN